MGSSEGDAFFSTFGATPSHPEGTTTVTPSATLRTLSDIVALKTPSQADEVHAGATRVSRAVSGLAGAGSLSGGVSAGEVSEAGEVAVSEVGTGRVIVSGLAFVSSTYH